MFFLFTPLEFDDCGSEKSKELGGAGPQPKSDRSRDYVLQKSHCPVENKMRAHSGSRDDEAIRSAEFRRLASATAATGFSVAVALRLIGNHLRW